jgi:predicted RNA-binding Zn-ribbon protein involved in translation (DUF1610 family)
MSRLIVCPSCGSDNLRRSDVLAVSGVALVCEACGHSWEREPGRSCPRCGSPDVEESAYEGWSYDDLAEARETTMASWEYVERRHFRCRACRHAWGNVPA